jgi:hypothetical protein
MRHIARGGYLYLCEHNASVICHYAVMGMGGGG